MKEIILASTSPRRQALLEQVAIPFTIKTGDVDESMIQEKNPAEKVKKLAKLKGQAVLAQANEIILAADTVVSYEESIFEKPQDEDEAYQMIASLSGTTHEVYTGVYLRRGNEEIVFAEKTSVTFSVIEEAHIKRYVKTKEPYDKAGAYGIQSVGALFVKEISGDFYNVVGLPLSRTIKELEKIGFHYFH